MDYDSWLINGYDELNCGPDVELEEARSFILKKKLTDIVELKELYDEDDSKDKVCYTDFIFDKYFDYKRAEND